MGTFPFMAVLLGIMASVGLGIALFAAGRFMYIYILYNSLIGIGVGAAIAYGLAHAKYNKRLVPILLVVVCAFISYLTYNIIALMLYVLSQAPGGITPEVMLEGGVRMYYAVSKAPGESIGFLQFLQLRAENEPFIRGARIGAIGNYVVWFVEYLITAYFAWSRVSVTLRLLDVQSVPPAVLGLIAHFLAKNYSVEDVKKELASRGWSRPEDQETAFVAACSLVSLLQQEQQEKKQ
jgi:hypothetical protein